MENKVLRRRWLGGISLAVAVFMLVLGETVLRERLKSSLGLMILYYLMCFLLTFLAVLVAFVDLSAVRRRTHDEQRALLEDTMGEIARRKRADDENPSHRGNSKPGQSKEG